MISELFAEESNTIAISILYKPIEPRYNQKSCRCLRLQMYAVDTKGF